MSRIANGDLVVVIPGILGSALYRGTHQVWGYRQIFANVHRLADRLSNDLTFNEDPFEEPSVPVDDGIRATGLMRTLGIIPGFLSIQGYDDLVARLRRWFAEDREFVHEFPYDWRQSNEYTARRLKKWLMPMVQARRKSVPEARVILVGHSMGGLVARYYAECLDEHKFVRRVVTIGTPYRGSVKALALLANGHVRLGPTKLNIGDFARSIPSVAELLPTYRCLGSSVEDLAPLGTSPALPGFPEKALERSRVFHQQIVEAIAANGDARPSYYALLSHRQRTQLWAFMDERNEVRLRESDDFDNGGDGTVPRCSASPPEWSDDAGAVFITGRHGGLQQQPETLTQVRGILSTRPRIPQAVSDEISVDAESFVESGGTWNIECHSVEGSNTLVLTLTIVDPGEEGARPRQISLKPQGGGRYSASVPMDHPGLYRWNVHTELMAAHPIDSVSDILLCTGTDPDTL